ncbi:MAG TPA: WhiB family transcriptional regulator [Egibacteraceae bacterium]|nr:WhiB family transcriptional regulator [Egibacteraceae bacterium]
MGQSWQGAAACRGMDVERFYSDDTEVITQALAVCGGCIVRAACFAHALSRGEAHGVWGGTREQQRRRAQRRLRSPAA